MLLSFYKITVPLVFLGVLLVASARGMGEFWVESSGSTISSISAAT